MPLLQRDYAQGRDTAKESREGFVDALHEALLRIPDDTGMPLNLDFVYGSMEEDNGKYFLPLDGQQRLTTLFLLHWYLAWQDGALPGFQTIAWDGRHSRFSYAVRPSSTEFFDELAQYVPGDSPEQVASMRRLLENQPWFYLHWRLDPTIQSALTMLDAIHVRFGECNGLFSRLLDRERPAITFQLLPLEHFGLSDDLYIKMNVRGKPLTPFETFKARFEEHLEELYPTERREIGGTSVPVHDFFSRCMDTRWTDFFWSYRTSTADVFDIAVMNLFWIIAWGSVDPSSRPMAGPSMATYRQGVGGYSEFHDMGLLTNAFADNLLCLLEAWSSGGGRLKRQLLDDKYFDEQAFFAKASTSPSSLQYGELVLFAAFISYLRVNEGTVRTSEFQEWMRVTFNLVQNSDIERPDDFERSLGGLQKLPPYSREILPRLATMEAEPLGFNREQVQEESLKARLMLARMDWADRIHEAEDHGYFRGQIGFLLDFSGTRARANEQPVPEWTPGEHAQLQRRFDNYLPKAKLTFSDRGLADLPGEPDQW
ncbi:MAG: GmrSD restriction endonuclease domain-containing protein [Syntrophobacteraceae bacterium]